MRLLHPLPRPLSAPLSALALLAWALHSGLLVERACRGTPLALAADLARYGAKAQWKGVYYRGEKIGYVVGQTLPEPDGYELREDGRLQMNLLGATTAARIETIAHVDRHFVLHSFSFSLDPGTGPTVVSGALAGTRLSLRVKTSSGERTEERQLEEAPALQLNLARRLAAEGLSAGQLRRLSVFDPATLKNAPMELKVLGREVVEAGGRPVPAFRVESRFAGILSTSWVTDVGEVVREESPTGLLVVRESPERATALAVPGSIQADMLAAAAIVPPPGHRIDDPRAVRRLAVRLAGLEGFSAGDLQGAGQLTTGDRIEIVDARTLTPGPLDPERRRFLGPEPFLESDAPAIVEEAARAVAGATGNRARAEQLVRHVHALLEKKPTVSLPSALEVLRTRVGDCNEHSVLYVALARAAGLPARIAVGLVHLTGAFYYHAWAEVYLEAGGQGLWLPVDPTLNEFPADATHLRLARGGLERQTAILGLMGHARMSDLEVDLAPEATPILVGARPQAGRPPVIELPRRAGRGRGCWSSPPRR